MTSVFIVRPFGTKPVTVKGSDGKDTSVDVDFDEVERVLIGPALAQNGLRGVTTGAIAEAGNIRFDMFQMLITHDLVIADISIDNANVFYELGIRHGLRPKGTILLRFPTSGKDVPFDLKTDRYIEYDREKPAGAVGLLARSIKDTVSAMRGMDPKPDSPVFLLLPELDEPDPAKLIVVPREFQEAVERAENDPIKGEPMLALLGEEAKRSYWAREGLRLVGLAQRRIKSFKAALRSWEFIRSDLPNDVEANLQLATIFQRLGDFDSASQACRRVLDSESAKRGDRADARSQLARNEKASWVADFKTIGADKARRQQALGDSRLVSAFEGYMAGFAEDLNTYYSGINALGLLTVIVKLAEIEKETWNGNFASEEEAAAALRQYQTRLNDLRGAMRVSLDSAGQQSVRTGKKDEWLPPSEAQYKLLTADKAGLVKAAYNAAKNAGGKKFPVDSEAEQVAIFGSLGIFPENVRTALEALGVQTPPPGAATGTVAEVSTAQINKAAPSLPPRDRVIVATGHRVDAAGRQSARFPNTRECIDKAKAWLREVVEAEKTQTRGAISGIAGAASGTDLLFHEVCGELGIKTKVVLPIPAPDYSRDSVADGGPDWVEKFNGLVNANPPVFLGDDADLPVWASTIPQYGVYQRGNIFMMESALLAPNADVTLLALWNGKAGDGPGGTADMVQLAKDEGAKTCVKDSSELFGLPGSGTAG
jgi:hypothetical protein